MKKLVVFAILFMAIRFSAFAQPQVMNLINDRGCPVQVRLCGNCLGGSPCDFCLLISVPAISTVTLTDVVDAISKSTTPGATPPSCPLTDFFWHLADVQNNDCCDGAGLTAGDGTCAVPGPPCYTTDPSNEECPGRVWCLDWTVINVPPSIDLRIY